MKTLPPRLIAATFLALLASALVINAGPWPSFARFAESYFKPHTNYSKQATQPSSEQSRQSSLEEPSLKSGSYFTIYRNEQGEAVCRSSTESEVRQMQVNTHKLNLRPINHPELFSTQTPQEPQAPGSGLTIILRATQQLQQNPAAVAAFTRAAQNWEALVMSPVTIYIDVDFGPTFFGQTFPSGVLGATSAPDGSYPYESARTNLVAEANGEGNVTKQAVFDALPSTTVPTDLGSSGATIVSDPTARAIGLLPATAASADPAAKIGFNSSFTFDFDPSDGITSGQLDFDAVATHEIGHALGFHSEAGLNLPRPAVWDLYRFRTGTSTGTFTNAQRLVTTGGSPDPLQFFFVPGNNELGLSTGGPSGSFANGGDGWQSSHWKHATSCSPYIGIMDPAIGSGCRRTITTNDTLALSYFGYNLTNNNQPPPPPTPPPPPANDNFINAQLITGCSGSTTGTSFGATSEPGEPSHAPNDPSSLSPNHTVWYQWQPPSTGTTTITTAGSELDTILAVYTGASVGSLTRIVFNDDAQSGTLTSSVTFSATGGATYRIAVDGWSGDTGGIKLNWNGCVVPTPTPTPTPTATPTPTPVPCPNQFSGIFTVNSDADLGDAAQGDGICQASNGLCTLRAAIQEANALVSCFTININLGGVSGPISLASALPDINHNVNINGPGANQLTVQRSTQIGTTNFRVFTISSGRTVAISGLTISNGLVPGGSGGGVLNNNSGTLTLTDCNVYGNSVGTTEGFGAGGGIYNAGSLILNNCRVGGTAAGQPNTSGANGGGITTVGTLQMNEGLIAGNSESGIYVGGGTAALIGVTVSNNSARNTGGGVRVGAVANLVGCGIANNIATYGGAGIYNGLGTVKLIDSTVSGNTSNQFAGGIYSFNATSTTLINSTVTNNRSTNGNGGGLQNSGSVLLRNSIVAGNFIGPTGTTSDDVRDLVSSASAFNLIGSCNSCGLTNGSNNNQVGVSGPGLGPLANNGGLTQTHALLSGSPAINAGSNAIAVDQNGNPLTTDQRGVGFNRIVNGTVDIGAFEVQTAAPPTPTPTPTPTPNPTPTPPSGACPTVLTVNDNGDASDAFPGDGACLTAGGVCTLRAAILEVNSRPSCGTIDINFSGVSTPISLNAALPTLIHNINLNGPGASELIIQRSTAAGTPDFRVFTIGVATIVNISNLTVSNGRLASGNTGQDDGGGIYNSGTLSILNSNISNNTGDFGAGIYNLGSLSIINSSILNNRSIGGPGAGILSTGTGNLLTIINSTVANNIFGGGIFIGTGVGTIINSTIANNTAQGGGAGILSAGTATTVNITNSTITGNRADSTGISGGVAGGIERAGGTVTLNNTIVALNFRGPSSTPDDIFGTVNAASAYNLIGTGGSGGLVNGVNNNLVDVANPLLGALGNYGGQTMTHALLSGSPAINGGSNTLALDQNGNSLATDQRGFSRIVNSTVDIGAVEFGGAAHLFTDATNHVIAIDSVTFVRDPFSVAGLHNFNSDQRTRVMIFTSNLGLTQPSAELAVTAGGIPLTVEGVGQVAGVSDVSYIIVKLDPMLSGNVSLSVTFLSVTSNAGVLSISP